jgi:hypothetical protein
VKVRDLVLELTGGKYEPDDDVFVSCCAGEPRVATALRWYTARRCAEQHEHGAYCGEPVASGSWSKSCRETWG